MVQVFIATAADGVLLAGVVASLTILPVLAVPMESNLQGLACSLWFKFLEEFPSQLWGLVKQVLRMLDYLLPLFWP